MVSDNLPDIHYDQLIITKNMIPSDDLGINGDYGRHLIIPDDVLNTLSHIVTPQNGVPRIATMDTDGGVNVHVTNPSGGGGGGSSKAIMKVRNGLEYYDLHSGNVIEAIPQINTLYSAMLVAFSGPPTGAGPSGFASTLVTFSLLGNVIAGRIDLGRILCSVTPIGGGGTAGLGYVNIVYNPPIDVAGSLGSSGVEIWINSNGDANPFGATFSLNHD